MLCDCIFDTQEWWRFFNVAECNMQKRRGRSPIFDAICRLAPWVLSALLCLSFRQAERASRTGKQFVMSCDAMPSLTVSLSCPCLWQIAVSIPVDHSKQDQTSLLAAGNACLPSNSYSSSLSSVLFAPLVTFASCPFQPGRSLPQNSSFFCLHT